VSVFPERDTRRNTEFDASGTVGFEKTSLDHVAADRYIRVA
jgi:hypothetical protein